MTIRHASSAAYRCCLLTVTGAIETRFQTRRQRRVDDMEFGLYIRLRVHHDRNIDSRRKFFLTAMYNLQFAERKPRGFQRAVLHKMFSSKTDLCRCKIKFVQPKILILCQRKHDFFLAQCRIMGVLKVIQHAAPAVGERHWWSLLPG